MFSVGLDVSIIIYNFNLILSKFLINNINYELYFNLCYISYFFTGNINLNNNNRYNSYNINNIIYSEDEIKQIIFGSLLGDAKLEFSNRSKNARLGFIQSVIHSNYLYFLFNILNNYCLTPPKEYSYFDERTKKTYISLNF
jgi:hypothetical protein